MSGVLPSPGSEERAGVLLAVWGKGTAVLLPAVLGRWLRVDECRHDILVFIARVFPLSLACVKITGGLPLGFTRVLFWMSCLMVGLRW